MEASSTKIAVPTKIQELQNRLARAEDSSAQLQLTQENLPVPVQAAPTRAAMLAHAAAPTSSWPAAAGSTAVESREGLLLGLPREQQREHLDDEA